jgi:hypothetical protein
MTQKTPGQGQIDILDLVFRLFGVELATSEIAGIWMLAIQDGDCVFLLVWHTAL